MVQHLRNLSVPETLLKISKIAMLSSQLAGYLPFSVHHRQFQNNSPTKISPRKNNLLKHSFISIPSMSSFLGLLVIIGWTVLYYSVFKPKIRFVKIFGPTESFAYTMIVIMGTTAGVILRFRGFRVKDEISFFQDNCSLLQHLEDFGLKVSELREISKIPRYINISFSAYIVPLVIHCILVHCVRPVMAYYQYGKWLPDIVYTIGSGFWVLWSYLLISNLWIILFPRLYCACYKEISKDIGAKFQNQGIKSNHYLSEIWRKSQQKNDDHLKNIYTKNDAYDADLEAKVGGYLELILNLGKIIDKFNHVFGERLVLEMITCITFIVLYAFFGCFWLNRGDFRIIGEVVTPLYVNGKKLIELGYSCGNISNEAQVAMKTLIRNVPLDKLSLKMCRKIRLIQIQIQSSPPTVSAKQFFTISRGSVTTFISDFQDLDQTQTAIFFIIISTNSYTPLFLDNVENWDTTTSRYNLYRILNSSVNVKIFKYCSRLGHTDFITFLLTPTIRYDGPLQKHEVHGRTAILANIFNAIIFANENPTYAFIHLDFKISRIISHFPPDTTVTSHIVIFGSGYPAHIMCHPCKSKVALMHDISKLSDISNLWKQRNTQNFRNAIVSGTSNIIGMNVPFLARENCIANFGRVKLDEEICAEAVILEKHNFSYEVYRADVAPDGSFSRNVIIASRPIYNTLADKRFNELNIMQRSLTKTVWYNYAINYIPFTFVVVVQREMSFGTLMMPFDKWTWTLSIATLIGVVVASTGFNLGRGDSFLKILSTVWNQLYRIISTIFGQPDMRIGRISRRGRVLIFTGVWYATVFVLGNFYQGALCSCMTSIGIPNVPQELADLLVHTDFDIVTMSQVTTDFNGLKAIKSTLSAAMIPDLLRASNSPSSTKFLQTLNQRTQFLTGNIFEIGFNISRNYGITSENATSVSIQLPFVILDRIYELNTLIESLTMFSNPIVLRNHAITPFVSLVPWHGKRNFLYPMFSEELGHLLQSGIYYQWQKYKNADIQRNYAKNILTIKEFKMFSAKKMSESEKEINFMEASSVSFNAMKYAFALSKYNRCGSITLKMFANFFTKFPELAEAAKKGLILGGGLFILGTLVENHLVEETSKKALRTIRLEQKDQEIQLTRLQAALESLKHDVRDLKRYEAHVEMASSSLSRSLERNIQYMQARDKEAREKGSANTSLE
ncbi:hypothetical protein Fcan01_19890 [Folsomia candida]|uniref:Uncharacterized protein n=2 Tax=Folsomia candida TaxID=158441 RepID=A0A226DJ35_FOLCA|nr:hypothetical protein Fcan01_19890 [Folsomia candida]